MCMQIIMVAALMIQLKMVILCFTWHAYMAIYLVCRFTLLSFMFFLRLLVVSNYGHLVSYCWNVELDLNAKMKKEQFLFMMLVLEVCFFKKNLCPSLSFAVKFICLVYLSKLFFLYRLHWDSPIYAQFCCKYWQLRNTNAQYSWCWRRYCKLSQPFDHMLTILLAMCYQHGI